MRIEEELAEFQKSLHQVQEGIVRVRRSSDSVERRLLAQGIALDIHSFYTGIERIFEAIAHSVDQNVPAGSEWHKDLLEQMTVASSRVRPSVIKTAKATIKKISRAEKRKRSPV